MRFSQESESDEDKPAGRRTGCLLSRMCRTKWGLVNNELASNGEKKKTEK